MKIHTKFVLFTNLVVWSTGAVLLIATAVIYKASLEESLAQSREMELVKWQAVCHETLVEQNLRFMSRYAQVLELQPGVKRAYYAGADGSVVTAQRGGVQVSSSAVFPGDPDVLEISKPVMLDDREAGRAVVGFSRRYQRETLARSLLIALVKVLFVTLLTAVATILAAGLFADRIARRLKLLRNAALEVEHGNFSVRLPPSSDEFGFFTNYFNRMAERLAELDQRKNDFISSVSHDLKSPLAVVHMWIDRALNTDPLKDQLNPQHKQLLINISDTLARQRVYISNILDAAKLATGQISYHVESLQVDPVLQHIRAIHEVLASKRQVRIVVKTAPDLPQIKADSECFEHAVANLVSNAVKFTHTGGCITMAASDAGDRVEVSVADTGSGIAEEDLPNLFQRFRQFGVADQRKKNIKGTGLGLYIVKQNIEGIGGSVRVESKLGEGTKFTLSLLKSQ